LCLTDPVSLSIGRNNCILLLQIQDLCTGADQLDPRSRNTPAWNRFLLLALMPDALLTMVKVGPALIPIPNL